MSRHPAEHECTGDLCGFRHLYESSQASLADMSARQGQALARVGRLRSGIVLALRRNFPDLAGRAEQQMGTRMSEVDDEILIAYLDAFTGQAVQSPVASIPVDRLLQILKSAGLHVDGTNPDGWVEQLRS